MNRGGLFGDPRKPTGEKKRRKVRKVVFISRVPLWATGAYLFGGPLRNHVEHVPELIH